MASIENEKLGGKQRHTDRNVISLNLLKIMRIHTQTAR
jgi:hypothetical protein